ncbi:hypothetical protein SAMN05421755_103030 [Nitrosomonas sp. Nm33]|nr:hypothetical protein SAMN05421755_103030 [Nitrosomonas sp. Nm33]
MFNFTTTPTTKLCGANEAQRSLRPNERLVSEPSKFLA